MEPEASATGGSGGGDEKGTFCFFNKAECPLFVSSIESTFATIRLRHRKTKGSGTRRTSLAMMFKLAQSAARKWRRLSSHDKITLVIEGRIFKDGIVQDAA
ncbi:hypothetical protein Pla175_47770 [Pirellulimonas nuda]|uniref:Transposase, Mutator family n=1 Tax=Pirellulimonas nuda TaxID=2528009 RepID=A0A518DIQ4_9BACT|nr:hypothetical protein [Pirellulimonas nuda]QDU91355.1 hypothetical protein Pla175_47770 [Pirellulimonas nuda]